MDKRRWVRGGDKHRVGARAPSPRLLGRTNAFWGVAPMAPGAEVASRSLTAAASAQSSRANHAPSSSPSRSTDADMPNDTATAKRAAHPADKPPLQKRPRRLTWYDSVRDAWKLLTVRFPERNQFKLSEIVDIVSNNWSTLRGKEKKSSRWKKDITICIRSDNMLTRSADTTDEYYVVRNLSYTPKVNAKKNQPEKKKDLSDEDAKLPEEQLSRATIPSEWTAEAFKPVRLSTFDKSPAIQFIGDPSENKVKGFKGFRMVRSTSGVCEGDWFFEAKILSHEGDGAVRLGWSQRRSDPETPVGFDVYGYGYRDRTGGFVHAARVRPYAEQYGVNDIIGCRIKLPDLTDQQKQRIKESDQKWLHHRFINLLQGQPPSDCDIDIHGQAFVQFYKNGREMGIPAFFTEKEPFDSRPSRKNGAEKRPNEHVSKKSSTSVKRRMCAGYFYPSISLFGNAVVQANFGPNFWFEVPEGSKPMSEAARDIPQPKLAKDVAEPAEDEGGNVVVAKDPLRGSSGNHAKSHELEDSESITKSSTMTARNAHHDNVDDDDGDQNSEANENGSGGGHVGYGKNSDCNRHEQIHVKTHIGKGVLDCKFHNMVNSVAENPSEPGKGSSKNASVEQSECESPLPPRTHIMASQSNTGSNSNTEPTRELNARSSAKATIGHIINP